MDVVFVACGAPTESVEAQLRSLPLLGHRIHAWIRPAGALVGQDQAEVIVVDGAGDVSAARRYCRDLAGLSIGLPVLVVLKEQSLGELSVDWGVSDFLLDGYSLAEIHSRLIRASTIARRAVMPPPVRRYGALTLDRERLTLSIADRSVALTHIEHAVLTLFFDNPETVQTREAILHHGWADSPAFASRNIDTFICRIRRKLGDYGGYIHTVRNVGYRFSARTDPWPDASARPDWLVA